MTSFSFIIYITFILALPPTLQSDSGTVSVVKKKTAILKCKFAASPKVSFIWKGPSSDKIIEEGSRQDTPNEGILEIKGTLLYPYVRIFNVSISN